MNVEQHEIYKIISKKTVNLTELRNCLSQIADINSFKGSLFIYAFNNIDIANMLVEFGIDVHNTWTNDNESYDIFSSACKFGRNDDVIRLLINLGCDIHKQTIYSNNLDSAMLYRSIDVVRVLLDNNIIVTDNNIIRAFTNDNVKIEVVRLIMEHFHGDINTIKKDNKNLICFMEDIEKIKFLIEIGYNCHKLALLEACNDKNIDKLKYLLDFPMRDQQDELLILACQLRFYNMAKFLLSNYSFSKDEYNISYESIPNNSKKLKHLLKEYVVENDQ